MSTPRYIDEDLKGRMLRRAAILWGVKNTDALDPLIRLLIEALAGELRKTYHEINDFENRILEKIAVMMTPGLLSAPYCAHAIAFAQPIETKHRVKEVTQFLHRKKVSEKDTHVESFFTSVGNVDLINGEAAYWICGNKMYSVDSTLNRMQLATGKGENSNKSLWIGLRLPKEIKSLHGLRLYLDFKNNENQKPLLVLLQNATWSCEENQLEVQKGVVYAKDELRPSSFSLFSTYDPMELIEQEVKHFYEDHFVTLWDPKGDFNLEDRQKHFPSELEKQFAERDIEKIPKGLIWVKAKLGAELEQRKWADLFVCMNAFPVVNRKLSDKVQRFKGVVNLIPIKPNHYDYFLSVYSLKNDKGIDYKQIPYSQGEIGSVDTYSVRRAGAERIDTRSAKDFLSYLTELMRDESSAFSSYGNETVGNILKEIEKLLAQIEMRVQQNRSAVLDSYHYVVVDLKEGEHALFLEYWTTNGPFANNLHAGSLLTAYADSEFVNNSAFLLTNTVGGKKPLDASRHMDAYKYAMLTHNRLVTVEDIRAFCMFELGDKIAHVDIKKGVIPSENPKEGLIRCLEIVLTPMEELNRQETKEWKTLLAQTKAKMERRSALNLHFRLHVGEIYC